MRDLLVRGRPNARNARVTKTQHLDEIERAVNEFLAPTFQAMDQGSMMGAQMGIRESRSLRVAAVEVNYFWFAMPLLAARAPAETYEANEPLFIAIANSLMSVDDYRNPDGTSISLPSDYDHVFTDDHGGYLLSNDPHFDPNRHDSRGGWQTIEPAR